MIISDMEVLRMHYSYTLRHWKERFLGKKEQVLAMFDEKFFRMWEFYLARCEMAFKWGDQVVFQFQLSKKLTSVPNTRDYIYQINIDKSKLNTFVKKKRKKKEKYRKKI